jgi:hypothetical protein
MLSSRDFNQDTGRAKRLAEGGPVCITDRGRPTFVLMTFGDYRALVADEPSVIDLLGSSPAGRIVFEIERTADVAVPASLD